MKRKGIVFYNYREYIPKILLYQAISKAIMAGVMFLHRQLAGLLLWNLDRTAFTSGDLPYLMRSWQGWALIFLGFVILVIYTVFDINAMILISDRFLHQKPLRAIPLILEAFGKLKNLKNPQGILAVLYVSLFAPFAGAVFGITLTADISVPEFIMAVINDHILYRILYYAVIIMLALTGVIYVFSFHYAILGDYSMGESMKRSRLLMKAHWKDFLVKYLGFVLESALCGFLLMGLTYRLPLFILHRLSLKEYTFHVWIIFFTVLMTGVLLVYGFLFLYFSMMKLTIIYESHTLEEQPEYILPEKGKHRLFVLALIAVHIVILIYSLIQAKDFERNFPAYKDVYVVAHRGGGTLANENTVLSLQAAIEHNAQASEIDVQRTKDGYYIINHDKNFKRCCGVEKKPGEMTLEEIKTLQVFNAQNPLEPATEVATLEEMLDTAKGKILLYIELKGESADSRMAEDIYRMVTERDMLDQCVLISMNYGIIDEIETTHPEVKTGYLCYLAFGNLAKMNCDMLLLEEETATDENVRKIHAAGKEVNVWTVNSLNVMIDFMTSDVDGIITDEVELADTVRQLLDERSDEARVLQKIFDKKMIEK